MPIRTSTPPSSERAHAHPILLHLGLWNYLSSNHRFLRVSAHFIISRIDAGTPIFTFGLRWKTRFLERWHLHILSTGHRRSGGVWKKSRQVQLQASEFVGTCPRWLYPGLSGIYDVVAVFQQWGVSCEFLLIFLLHVLGTLMRSVPKRVAQHHNLISRSFVFHVNQNPCGHNHNNPVSSILRIRCCQHRTNMPCPLWQPPELHCSSLLYYIITCRSCEGSKLVWKWSWLPLIQIQINGERGQ